MTIAIAQPTGVGSAVGELGLSGAWLEEPVVITLPAAQYVYETTILDFSTGCTVTLGGAATAAPTITPTGGKGSVRFMARYRATSVSRWITYYRVIRFQRNADGTNWTNVAPTLLESPAETAEARGYADILDLVVAGVNAAGLALPEAGFTGLVDLTGSSRAIFSDTGTVCVIGLDTTTDFLPGAQYELLIPAGEATDLEYGQDDPDGPNLDPEGDWDPFDAGADYLIAVAAISADKLVSVGKSLVEPTYTTPTIVSAEVDATDLDKLTVTFSRPCLCPIESITGLSLGGTMAIARTIASVFSGNGTTAIIFDLSGDLDVGDAATFVVGSTRTLQATNGPKIAAGSTAITFANLDYDWSAVTGATFDLIASAGIGVADGAVIPSWTDQIASEAATEATNRPIYRATGVNGFPAVEFDGTNDKFLTSGADVVSDWMGTPGDFEIIAVVQADTVVDTGADFDCHGIWNGVGTTIGMGLYRAGGVTYTLLAWVYDGVAYRYASRAIGASLPAHGVVCEMRLTGGNLIASVDGVDGTPTASGAPLNYGGYLRIGSNRNDTVFLDGKIARIVGKSGNGTKETAAINAFIAKYQ